jgi:hypothetical protein
MRKYLKCLNLFTHYFIIKKGKKKAKKMRSVSHPGTHTTSYQIMLIN